MSLIVGGAGVATAMSPLVEGALYADEVFADGVSFTSRYKMSNAGQIQVPVNDHDSILEPKVPGSDFTRNAYTNRLIDINCVNGFILSQDVPNYYQATMPIDVQGDAAIEATKTIMEGRQGSGIGCLVNEGTVSEDTTALTKNNIRDIILNERLALRKRFAKADVVLARAEVYNLLLQAAGASYTPIFNDEVQRTGRIGNWLGMTVIEANLLDGYDTVKYRDGVNVNTVDLSKVDFAIYDHSAFSIVDVLQGMRIIDSEDFFGAKVQGELDTGYKVTRAAAVSIKKHA